MKASAVVFDGHIYSASLVERGKPAPDLFLHAADQLGEDPARCVVIEDSAPGVTAGGRAGMFVIGFTAAGHCGPDHDRVLLEARADTVAGKADDLGRILNRMLSDAG